MIELIAFLLGVSNLDQWKQDVYDIKYNQAIVEHIAKKEEEALLFKEWQRANPQGSISWYGTGTKGLYTACWNEYPKGTKFKVTFNGKSIVVTCNDYGDFKPMGRVLDLSGESFRFFKPLDKGIIRGAKVEVIK